MKWQFFSCLLFALLSFSCSDGSLQNKPAPGKTEIKTLPKNKPGSTFQDSLKIDFVAAVFYSPDSLQLQKIKSVTDPGVFESRMHEFDFLMRTAHSVMKKNYPKLKIIEAKNVRYLLFKGVGNRQDWIDLDKVYDPYGLFIFNRAMSPKPVDMANTETELGFYFAK